MIASEDVRRVTFDRTMRGYRCEDVDDYLKQVADSLDAMAAEREELQKKLVVLAQRIDQYRADEDTLRTTMLNAQRLGENVIKEAKQKAAEIIRAANIKAEDREQHARDEVELAQQELVTIYREADNFKKSLMDKYRKHIELLHKLPSYPEETPKPGVKPAPKKEPEPIPVPPPAPEPIAPPVEPEPQAYEEPNGTAYYPPAEPTPAEKVDTVEFAMAGVDEYDQQALDAQAGALYEAPAPQPAKSGKRGRSKASSSLPEGLESFAGVDFDS